IAVCQSAIVQLTHRNREQAHSYIWFCVLPQVCLVPAMMRGISIAQDRAVPHGLPQTFRP
ncbi:hypothetical protein, partial [Pseudomonas sp. PB106]|uniref:hypothetical protein n=1 Tax=Pseudomonas sp. PB106 TaxID=2494699 RepID=UPI001C49C251